MLSTDTTAGGWAWSPSPPLGKGPTGGAKGTVKVTLEEQAFLRELATRPYERAPRAAAPSNPMSDDFDRTRSMMQTQIFFNAIGSSVS